MLYVEFSQSYSVTYPRRLPGGGKGEGIPIEKPYCKARQILSQCRCGYWTALLVWLARHPSACLLASGTFLGLQKVAGRLICHGAFPGAITRNYISLRTDGLASNFISAQVCVFTQD